MNAQQQNPFPAYYRTLITLHAGQVGHELDRRQDESAKENAGYRPLLLPLPTKISQNLTTFTYRPKLLITPNDSRNILQHVHSTQYRASNETAIVIQPNVHSENRSRIRTVRQSILSFPSTWQQFCSTCLQGFPSEDELILHHAYHKSKWPCVVESCKRSKHPEGFQRQSHNSSHQPLEASLVTFEEPAGPAIPSAKESSSFGPITKKRRNSLDSSPIYEKKRKTVEEDGKGANPKAISYDIQVLQMFSDHKEALIRNQEKAVRRGLVHTVKKVTRMHIVGCLTGYPRMVCVQVVYPSITSEELKTSKCIPICLVQKTDKIVAALILTSPRNCAQLAMTTKLVDFGDLDKAYQPFITWYDI
ncbi:hypothetical protein BS50DRAFT_595111 [Corynespora cassiicola Philippines]|uniref:C2H2-type domain-containing protein n=1 Tax=Corynespora cassiicola Philippines TaxID=1448308 RepID=A0A2T2N0T2_CORCC|nr:hypothetical protein BS50DRAFT_595111 [Corynespora cassiicola Philippines]